MRQSKAIVCSLLVFLTFVMAQGETIVQGGLAVKIDAYMTATAEGGFAGALLVAKDGEIILSKGYGLANRAKNIPVTPETVFTTGSITKQFTAAAIVKLEEQGKLSVNDPITRYFDNVPGDKANITLHQLLTHTAGFPGALGDDYEAISREAFIELAMNTPLRHASGETYEYSNVGYSLLAAIIELVTGQPYEVYLHDTLFVPAGMMKTGYVLPNWQPDELAHGYTSSGEDWGTSRDHPWAEDGPYWHLRGNGGILSTTLDMYEWHLALEGDEILSAESKRKLFTPYVEEGEGAGSFYGYGWAILETPRDTTLITHNGGNRIFHADFHRYVDEDVVLYITSSAGYPDATQLSWQLARMIFNPDYTPEVMKLEELSLEDLQTSVIGQRALAYLATLASSDEESLVGFISEHMSPVVLEQVSGEQLATLLERDRNTIGAVEVERIVQPSENALELTVRSKKTGERWTIALEFEREEPHRIQGLGIRG